MYPQPAPIITIQSLRLLSEMVRDATVILTLKAIRVYMVTAITEIMIVTSRLAGIDYISILDAKHCQDFMSAFVFWSSFLIHAISFICIFT